MISVRKDELEEQRCSKWRRDGKEVKIEFFHCQKICSKHFWKRGKGVGEGKEHKRLW